MLTNKQCLAGVLLGFLARLLPALTEVRASVFDWTLVQMKNVLVISLQLGLFARSLPIPMG